MIDGGASTERIHNPSGVLPKVVLSTILFVLLLFLTVQSFETSDGAEEIEGVVVTFDENLMVVCTDTSEINEFGKYKEYNLRESPSVVRFGNIIWALPFDSNNCEMYMNSIPYYTSSILLTEEYSGGINFELYRTDYLISFSNGGEQGPGLEPVTNLKVGSSYQIPSVPYESEWKYSVLWNTKKDGTGDDISFGHYLMNIDFIKRYYSFDDNNLFLYPKWIPKQYAFNFKENNGSGIAPDPIESITVGSFIKIPEVSFARTGYESFSWNTETNGSGINIRPGDLNMTPGTMLKFFSEENRTATLYPVWNKIQYRFSFNNTGSADDPPTSIVGATINNIVSIPSVELTRLGYCSESWNTSANGSGLDVRPGKMSLDEDRIRQLFGKSTVIDLYPRWVPNRYGFVFDSNGGTGEPPLMNPFILDSVADVPSVPFTSFGRKAAVWNTSNDGTGKDVQPGKKTITTEVVQELFASSNVMTLYPRWVEKEYCLKFNLNGYDGDVPEEIAGIRISDLCTVPSASFKRIGHTSSVWNTSSDGSGFDVSSGDITFTSNLIRDCFGDNDTVTLYPKWIKSQYSISFLNPDGTGTPPKNLLNFTCGNELTIPKVPFEKIGYSAFVWNTSPDGKGTSFESGSFLFDEGALLKYYPDGSSEVELYPEWVVNEYTIVYDSNGGSDIDSTTIGANVVSPVRTTGNIPTLKGYVFKGWGTAKDSSTVRVAADSDIVLGESEVPKDGETYDLFAIWEEKEYNVRLIVNGRVESKDFVITDDVPSPYIEPGFRFIGWYYDDGTGTSKELAAMSEIQEGMTLHARFEPIPDDPHERLLYPLVLTATFVLLMFGPVIRRRL